MISIWFLILSLRVFSQEAFPTAVSDGSLSSRNPSACQRELKHPLIRPFLWRGTSGQVAIPGDLPEILLIERGTADRLDQWLYGASESKRLAVGYVGSYPQGLFEDNGVAFFAKDEFWISHAEFVLELLHILKDQFQNTSLPRSHTVMLRRIHRGKSSEAGALVNSDVDLLLRARLILEFFNLQRWLIKLEVIFFDAETQQLKKQILDFKHQALASRGDYRFDQELLRWMRQSAQELQAGGGKKPTQLEVLSVLVDDLESLVDGRRRIPRSQNQGARASLSLAADPKDAVAETESRASQKPLDPQDDFGGDPVDSQVEVIEVPLEDFNRED